MQYGTRLLHYSATEQLAEKTLHCKVMKLCHSVKTWMQPFETKSCFAHRATLYGQFRSSLVYAIPSQHQDSPSPAVNRSSFEEVAVAESSTHHRAQYGFAIHRDVR